VISCNYIGRCGGCPWGSREQAEQVNEKLNQVRSLYKDVRFAFSPESRVRDRADLVWEEREGRMHLGLYALGSRDVVDITECPMMTAPLEAFFKDFRKRAPPVKRGSVRLRVAPSGERGVWLDFANTDVKTLFEEKAAPGEKTYLQWLNEIAFVEIGQRRKALTWKDGAPKLVDPVLKPWFESYAESDAQPIPLYGPVGGFSQTGFEANKALLKAVNEAVSQAKLSEWVELFCGNGNFTVSLAAAGHKIEAVEMDELAVEGLNRSAQNQPWAKNLKITRADVYLKTKTLPPLANKGLIADPPRAGLRETLTLIENGEKPEAIVYISCFTDVFIRDCAKLKELGYIVKSLTGVDQFPQSPHAEWVALLMPAE
jgi:23S rRNA (uracil1939-C5)-methyltransferase